MKALTRLPLFIILALMGLTSCRPNYEKIFKENNEMFDRNRLKLNEVIRDIERTYIKNWDGQNVMIVSVDSLNQKTKKTLNDLGIGSFEFSRNNNKGCSKNYWITLKVLNDWNIGVLRLVQLVYAPCDNYSKTNYHHADGLRDFWGQGDDWFIYSDSDYLYQRKYLFS